MSTNLLNQAHFQIEAMCFALQNAAKASDANDHLPFLVQALATRIIELNGGLMGMVHKNEDCLEDLKHAVFGFNAGVTQ